MPPTPSLSASAMLLAAGRGLRMRPLTDHTPKPLLAVQGKPLMQWSMEALMRAGTQSIVVNTGWLGEQIEQHARCWAQTQASIKVQFSRETHDFGHALETAGGIARALPLLGEVFWVLAGDMFVPDFSFGSEHVARFAAGDQLAHIWLVPNPAHHPHGDFGLDTQGLATDHDTTARLTYSTIGLYRRALFEPPWLPIPSGNPTGQSAALGPLLRQAIQAGRVSAERYAGVWVDVGTPERLAALNTP